MNKWFFSLKKGRMLEVREKERGREERRDKKRENGREEKRRKTG